MVAATFTQRAIGRAIDLAILSFLVVLVVSPFVEDDSIDMPPLFVSALIFTVLAYEIVPVYLRGQTAGKIITRTRIVTVDGGKVSLGASALRWGVPCAAWILVGGIISPPLAIVVMAALYLSALADPGGRNLLDRLAGTRVVRANVTVPTQPQTDLDSPTQ